MNLTTIDSLPSRALALAAQEGNALAIWRLPEQTEINLMMSTGPAVPISQPDLENGSEGFIISPFHKEGDNPSLLILPQLSMSSPDGEDFNINQGDGAILNHQLQFNFSSLPPLVVQLYDEAKEETHYMEIVRKGIRAIEEGYYKKLVLARKKAIRNSLTPLEVFQRLCDRYATAFVSMVFLPGKGIWTCATPERLVQVSDGKFFRTLALAGTQAKDEGSSEGDARWSQKEIEEQALVSRYIIDCFKQIRLREYIENGPRTVSAGNLMHLRTDYLVDMIATERPDLGTQMLKLLHPTSAVCGMPKDAAEQFIKENEGWDRSYFSGYLGPVNFNGTSDLYVNLRCMQIGADGAMLYAGAGITQDSKPDKEWQETELKCQTLLSVL